MSWDYRKLPHRPVAAQRYKIRRRNTILSNSEIVLVLFSRLNLHIQPVLLNSINIGQQIVLYQLNQYMTSSISTCPLLLHMISFEVKRLITNHDKRYTMGDLPLLLTTQSSNETQKKPVHKRNYEKKIISMELCLTKCVTYIYMHIKPGQISL